MRPHASTGRDQGPNGSCTRAASARRGRGPPLAAAAPLLALLLAAALAAPASAQPEPLQFPKTNTGNGCRKWRGGLKGTLADPEAEAAAPFRFWFDDIGMLSLLQDAAVFHALKDAGGAHVGGPIKPPKGSSGTTPPAKLPFSWLCPEEWDVSYGNARHSVWTLRAASRGQVVSALAGTAAITSKSRLPAVLQAAYGDDAAAEITPLTFLLPSAFKGWRAWLDALAKRGAGAAARERFFLKRNAHRGIGLEVMGPEEAYAAAVAAYQNRTKPDKWQIAQLAVEPQFRFDGQKASVRAYLLITAYSPLRAYIYNDFFVTFTTDESKDDEFIHPTAYGTRRWTQPELASALGEEQFGQLWARVRRAAAAVAAAARPLVARKSKEWRIARGVGYQIMGLDFVISEDLRPYLIEVNSAPTLNLGGAIDDPVVREIVRRIASGVTKSLVSILNIPGRIGRMEGGRRVVPEPDWRAELAAELANRGGFEPLMDEFPYSQKAYVKDSPEGGGAVKLWSKADYELAREQGYYPRSSSGGSGGGGGREERAGAEEEEQQQRRQQEEEGQQQGGEQEGSQGEGDGPKDELR